MAVVFVEGFDLYNGTGANTGLATRWTNFPTSNSGSISLVTGRFGGQALRASAGSGGFTLCSAPLPATYTSLTWAGSVRVATMTASGVFLWMTKDGSTQVCIGTNTLGAVIVYANDNGGATRAGLTELGRTATGLIFANTWHFIEVSTLIDGSAGTVAIKVDGAIVLSLTGKNTKPQSGSGVNNLLIGGSGSAVTTDIDDIYVLDSTTSLGECRVETLRASADTAQKDWTASSGSNNAAMVDETVANSTDYVQSTNVGDHDLYDMTDLSTTPTAIYAVSPVIFAEKTDSATRQLYLTIKSGATDEDGTAINLAASYNAFRRIDETNPDTSTAWTKTTVDAVKVGPKVAS